MSSDEPVHALDERPSAPPPDSARVRREIAVALVGAAPALHALAYARGVAQAMGAALHALCVRPTEILPRDVPRVLGVPEEALEGVVLHAETGEPADRLLAFLTAHPSAALVLAADEAGATDPFRVGAVAARLLAETEASLFIVRDAPEPRLKRILVPLDGRPQTAQAIGMAGELARRAGASLEVLLVGEAHARATEPGAMSPPQYVDQPQHEWQAFTREFLERFLGGIGHVPPEVTTRFYLGAGDPAEQILRFCQELDADLITLVWHGDATAEHGRVFRDVLSKACCPVLVLRC
ncbi:MAG TPA: universal stress protein [Minicystis sp.]|nr:universal stress protein [Minicystis sp.]